MATEEPKAPESVWPQFSLRTLLVGVAFVAVGCVALVKASEAWQTAIYTTTFSVLFIAMLGGLFHWGRTRAFWAGFAVIGWSYLLLVYGFFGESENHYPRLGTTRALLYIHMQVSEKVSVMSPDPSAVMIRYRPPRVFFMNIGQYLWALLLAYLGGLLARYFYSTRTRES